MKEKEQGAWEGEKWKEGENEKDMEGSHFFNETKIHSFLPILVRATTVVIVGGKNMCVCVFLCTSVQICFVSVSTY